jgi:hypothetical protein
MDWWNFVNGTHLHLRKKQSVMLGLVRPESGNARTRTSGIREKNRTDTWYVLHHTRKMLPTTNISCRSSVSFLSTSRVRRCPHFYPFQQACQLLHGTAPPTLDDGNHHIKRPSSPRWLRRPCCFLPRPAWSPRPVLTPKFGKESDLWVRLDEEFVCW